MKKFLCLLLTVAMLLCCLPALAADGDYNALGTGMQNNSESLTLSATIRQYLLSLQALMKMMVLEEEQPTEVQHLNVKFTAKTFTSYGFTQDAELMGGEYSVTFYDGGRVDFISGGYAIPGLTYTVNADGVYVIDYYGYMTYYATPTTEGFDLEMNGMIFHMVPAE